MFSLGIFIFFVSYAYVYAGVANLLNGGNGPTISEALGFNFRLAPPGADKLNSNTAPATTPSGPVGSTTNPGNPFPQGGHF